MVNGKITQEYVSCRCMIGKDHIDGPQYDDDDDEGGSRQPKKSTTQAIGMRTTTSSKPTE